VWSSAKITVGVTALAVIVLAAVTVLALTSQQPPRSRAQMQPQMQQQMQQPQMQQPQAACHTVIRESESESEYKQIGMLVSKDFGEQPPVMLPLFGRKMVGRDRYEYYTATDKINLWKIAVQYEHRDCQDRVGCQQIYDGVDVVVPNYSNKTFRASIYT
jgi:hypothetical protein